MIPLKLHIRNFLSYGPDTQEIDFEPYNLICLSGKNGHGKSALLDALTWVLWGQARKMSGVAKADDSLLRVGQHHMVVALNFICNGQQYRVRREYNKIYGKPIALLDVGLYDKGQDRFVPLGGKSIRESQALLDDILRLDFDSFCNSAFLRQGQSNEFSKKSPKERKDILSSILGLNEYEKIRKIASEKGRELANELATLKVLQAKCTQEVQALPTVEEALRGVCEQLQVAADQEAALKDALEDLAKEQQAALELHRQHAQTLFYIEQIDLQEAELKVKVRALVNEWRSVHARTLGASDYTLLEQEKKKLLEHVHQYQHQLSQHLSAKQRSEQAQQTMNEVTQRLTAVHTQVVQQERLAQGRLVVELEHLANKKIELQVRAHALLSNKNETEKRLQMSVRELAGSAACQAACDAEKAVFEKRKIFYQRLVADGNAFKRELEALAFKSKMSLTNDAPSCPMCEQSLTAERCEVLTRQWVREEQFVRHRFARVARLIPRLKELLLEQHERIQTLEQKMQSYQKMAIQCAEEEKKCAQYEQEINAVQQEIHACTTQEKILQERCVSAQQASVPMDMSAEVALRVGAEPSYQDAKNAEALCDEQLKHCAYDARAHEQTMQRLAEVERVCSEHQELISARAMQDKRKIEISQLIVQIRALCSQKEGYATTLNAYADLPAKQEKNAQRQRELEAQRTTLMQAKEKSMHEKGALEHRREYLLQVQEEYAVQQKKIGEVEEKIDDLQAVISATGKDGIQALLIQEVIPEVELEANALLAKLTDNQAQIFIESIRDLKKGGTRETLDINISDSVGLRAYELFSGGEAFRIDFALRIALSKLLARRAGTSLQTLIIDEGFGSQDDEGLGRIMDAIYKIQEDFAKVIIVSHLPAMKDQFPVQFYVEKKPNGSEVTVIEQG